METLALLGSLLGLSFVSGIRLYATVFVVGLGIRSGYLQLDPNLEALSVLADPLIITTAGLLYFVEFFADKIPWLDSAWDSAHTVIRPLGATVLAATALGEIDPALKIAVVLLCGTVALSGHVAKAGTRLVANHSPEPFSNIALSLGEDGLSLLGIWLSLRYPVVMLVIVVLLVGLTLWVAPKVYRGLRRSAQHIAVWWRGGDTVRRGA